VGIEQLEERNLMAGVLLSTNFLADGTDQRTDFPATDIHPYDYLVIQYSLHSVDENEINEGENLIISLGDHPEPPVQPGSSDFVYFQVGAKAPLHPFVVATVTGGDLDEDVTIRVIDTGPTLPKPSPLPIQRTIICQVQGTFDGAVAQVELGSPNVTANPGLATVFTNLAALELYLARESEQGAFGLPDSSYSTVTQPSAPTLPLVVSGPGVSQQVADAANALMANLEQQIGYTDALNTAINRANGAAIAGDAAGQALQTNAAASFASQLAPYCAAEPALRSALQTALQVAGVSIAVAPTDVANFQSSVVVNGLPTTLAQTLTQLGADATALKDINAIVLPQDSAVVAGNVPDKLTDPAVLSAAQISTQWLNDFAAGQYHVTILTSDVFGDDSNPSPPASVAPVPAPTPTSAPVPPPSLPPATPPPPANSIIAVGSDAGGLPEVKVYDARTGALEADFLAFTPLFTGGVRVAVGDVNGDGTSDIICGAGPGGGPEVRVFDGKTFQMIRDFMALPAQFTGGVFVAAGDVTHSGYDDIVTAADKGGGPQVTITDGETGAMISSFYATAPTFTGGIRVACADINGDGFADVIAAAGPGGGPQVTIFDGRTLSLLTAFYALAPTFTGGMYVAAGDILGNGRADIIVGAEKGGGPQVTVFDGLAQQAITNFYALAPTFTGGVRVAAAVTGTGPASILSAAGPGGGPQVSSFDGSAALLGSFFAFPSGFAGGVFVAGG
jgi:hypothetical protein